MLPIYNDFIKFLKDKQCPIELKEGCFWWDRNTIKCLKDNNEYKIARMWINEDLSIKKWTIYDNKNYPKQFDNWSNSYNYYESQIRDKEIESLQKTKEIINKYPSHRIILTNSTGKDSMLTKYLLDKITNNYELIFNNTTLDCRDSYIMAKQLNANIITPKMSNGENRSFYKMVEKHGTPSRFNRWCCTYFKEGATKQYYENRDNLLFIMGMRNEESATRSSYEYEWRNEQWTNNTWQGLLPIVKWNELELWLYTIHNNIQINPKYKKGYSRVGCSIACPYYTQSTWILDKYWYHTMYNRWHNILDNDFKKGEKWTRLNCTLKEYEYFWCGGQVRKEPTIEVIKEFMEYKELDNIEIAKQYFNKTCMYCGGKVYKKDEIAMNLKLCGRNINKFMCKKCLMKTFNITEQKWNEMVIDFKSQGCKLF